jgi:hypothetical protein
VDIGSHERALAAPDKENALALELAICLEHRPREDGEAASSPTSAPATAMPRWRCPTTCRPGNAPERK